MSSPTIRIFADNKRVSTAVWTKKGGFMQVFPSKKTYPSVKEWQDYWKRSATPQIKVVIDEACPQPPLVKLEDWVHQKTSVVAVPPGKYYIGDLCYVLGDELYDTIFGGLGYQTGFYANKKQTEQFFFLDNTSFGDGEYTGSDGNKFAVDAGIIGIAPMSCVKKNDGGGHFYTFEHPVVCTFKNGYFKFQSNYYYLTIET